MKELQINEELHIKCVENKEGGLACIKCIFNCDIDCLDICSHIKCLSNERIDGKNVYFEEIKD